MSVIIENLSFSYGEKLVLDNISLVMKTGEAVGVAGVSGGWIANGHFTFGDLTAAFQYRGGVLVGSLTLINCLVSIQASIAGIRRLNETMSGVPSYRHL